MAGGEGGVMDMSFGDEKERVVRTAAETGDRNEWSRLNTE
jgi:hypothetical protein